MLRKNRKVWIVIHPSDISESKTEVHACAYHTVDGVLQFFDFGDPDAQDEIGRMPVLGPAYAPDTWLKVHPRGWQD